MIKFLDLYKQDKKLHKSILKEINNLFKKGDYILGSKVEVFEKNFAKFCGTKYAIGCANGTDALTLALKSLDLPKNSEVIIPAMTYCSTAFSVIEANLKPILVDTDKLSPNISVHELKKKITIKTKVILPVHLYGSVSNLKEIKKIIKNKKIFLIDDCAQAHGAVDDSEKNSHKKIGSTTDISCFSLYPGKNLGAYGDAGIITTNNFIIYKKLKKLRSLGSEKKFVHEYIGQNSRLDTIQAIILNEKINGDLNLNVNKIYSSSKLIKSVESRIKFVNKNILVDQFLIDLGKLGAADITGLIKNDDNYSNFTFRKNLFIDNSKFFYSKFGVYNKSTDAKNLFIEGNFNLNKPKIRLNELVVDEPITKEDLI